MDGDALIGQLAAATGLPSAWVEEELKAILKKMGRDPAHVTLEDLRYALADFMQDVLLAAKRELA